MTAKAAALERHFQVQVIEYATLRGWRFFHAHDSRRQVTRADGSKLWIGDKASAGFPDLFLIRGTRIAAIELKSDTGRVTPLQTEWLDAMNATGHIEARVFRPSDFDTVLAFLD